MFHRVNPRFDLGNVVVVWVVEGDDFLEEEVAAIDLGDYLVANCISIGMGMGGGMNMGVRMGE